MEPFIFNSDARIPHFSLKQWTEEFPHLSVGFSSINSDDDGNHFNYALHVGAQYDQVIENRKRLAGEIGMPFSSWTSGEQVHGTHVAVVTGDGRGRGRLSQNDAFRDTDGLITREPDTLLATYYADCVPLYFYSPDKDILGVAHAGWKGTMADIAGGVIEAFIARGADVANIRAAIGPSIGACCYEVDQAVIGSLEDVIDTENRKQVIQMTGEMCGRLDLKKVNQLLMERAGISSSHISVSAWCTSCHPSYFYSYRRAHGKTGRMVAWIGKKEGEQ